ncbi:MAG: hypothetical protein N4A31_03915 [Rickettsiales bacterium]|jgi:hypothetical protein|nr:hypothetical protein [Rickettsiales bacterium]
MSEFNKVTIGRSPHDEECLINGLIRDFENAKDKKNLSIVGGTISLGLDNDLHSNDFVGDTLPSNTTQD